MKQESKEVISNRDVVQLTKLEDYIKNEPILNGALVGISVRSAANGALLYEQLGNTRLRPASNMKLLTGYAALSVLGEDHRFPTELWANGEVKGNILEGDLILKGKGDPTLVPEDFEAFAKKVKESGIKEINGDLIGDDTWYDDVRLSRDLDWSDEHWYYGAQISALTASPDKDYDSGSVIVKVSPGSKPGDQPTISVSPDTTYIKIESTAETVASEEEEDLTLNRKHGENTITIEGPIPVGSPSITEWMAVWEPSLYAMDLFGHALQEQGITWTGMVKQGRVNKNSNLLYAHKSMPLSELLIPFMKLSNNVHGEILVKEMGKQVHDEGSWEKGIEVMEEELKKIGLDIENLVIRDGSGISHVTLLPPNELTKLLYAAMDEPWFETYFGSLPVAGNPERMIGGTLRFRMGDLSVQAKTGTIAGVSTLSGYITDEGKETLIFSILLNNLLDEEDGPQVIDRMVEYIREDL
nr:D-alanyl-D-alanine carboxypeptidase/D-alanyl-D-alanine-endopeptidase [Ornithinibacillus caprae]